MALNASSISTGNSWPGFEGFNRSSQPLSNQSPSVKPVPPPSPSVNVSLSSDNYIQNGANTVSFSSDVYTKPGYTKLSDSQGNKPESDEAPELTDERQKQARSNEDAGPKSPLNLTEQEVRIIEKLKARDREVRVHEQAHKSVGGQYAGAISFSYQSGPDGRRYAVGGEVPIDVSPVPGNPEATIAKMTIVRAAATAPAQPSTQDIMVAAEASRILMEAQNELMLEKTSDFKDAASSEENESASSASVGASSDRSMNDVNEMRLGVFQAISSLDQNKQLAVDVLI